MLPEVFRSSNKEVVKCWDPDRKEMVTRSPVRPLKPVSEEAESVVEVAENAETVEEALDEVFADEPEPPLEKPRPARRSAFFQDVDKHNIEFIMDPPASGNWEWPLTRSDKLYRVDRLTHMDLEIQVIEQDVLIKALEAKLATLEAKP